MADSRYVIELLARNLVRLRKNRGLSQLQLSIEADLAVTFVNDLEHAKKWISPKSIAKLCGALGVEPYQLFLTENDSVAEKDEAIATCCDEILAETAQVVNRIRAKHLG